MNNDKKYIDFNKVPVTTADKVTLAGGILGTVKVILAAPPINIELPQEALDGFANLVGYGFIIAAMIRNNRRRKL